LASEELGRRMQPHRPQHQRPSFLAVVSLSWMGFRSWEKNRGENKRISREDKHYMNRSRRSFLFWSQHHRDGGS